MSGVFAAGIVVQEHRDTIARTLENVEGMALDVVGPG